MLRIGVTQFKGTQEEFYELMGKFFAEPNYRKQMPYMLNKPTHIWVMSFDKEKVVGFGAVNVLDNKVVFESSYVEEEYRKTGIWKAINTIRFAIAKEAKKTIEVISKEEHLKNYWIMKGFEVLRKNGRYFYLRKEQK